MRRNERINITVEEDLKTVMDSSRGLVKRSTYANHILRDYFVRHGLLPAAEGVHQLQQLAPFPISESRFQPRNPKKDDAGSMIL